MQKANHILSLLTVVLMLTAAAVSRNGRMFGRQLGEGGEAAREVAPDSTTLVQMGLSGALTHTEDYRWQVADGTVIYGSQPYAARITGYAGPTPLYIAVGTDGRIRAISAAPNNESPDSWREVVGTGMLRRWNGLSVAEAVQKQVDAVSGATMSSSSVIRTVRATLTAATGKEVQSQLGFRPTVKDYAALVVLLMGLLTAYLRKGRRWRVVQLILNVAVLGFWCGSFLSISAFTAWLSDGVNWLMPSAALLMAVLAVVMPLVGKRQYYCTYVCPLGSAQELAGKVWHRKWQPSPRLYKVLTVVRYTLLYAILGLMWTGVWFNAMHYELFSAFLWQTASIGIMIAAAMVLLLSVVVARPYCRYVCPTGTLLWLSQRE